ncbi:unnamed protein product [Leptidea sinapis]|uniref:non-specific serine/threonine protein kinase n=2 Tax=Leptidea sinapis TaxID=189913 RepID=A0A5E4QM61_9NEOP|nr:unnamed protein product [Leptidea sinapis]
MPRRNADTEDVLVCKKKKVVEELSSMDTSYSDDEALPPGLIFTDISKRQWRIGKPIGRGSFGRIYLVSDDIDKEVTKLNARYVVKIEPHTSGPLFVEIHCFLKMGQASKVKSWCQQHNLKRLGVPLYVAIGSFTDKTTNVKYRFLILPRYEMDLQKIITRTRVLDLKNVLLISQQILDILEYLHSQGYAHSDIKSSNLMLGFDGKKNNKNQVALPSISFEKDTKQAVVLSRRPKKAKNGKSRSSNYYDDEDFVTRAAHGEEEDKRLTSVKKKLTKILSNKDNRTLHRHHAFNLRQMSSYVNYEEMNSSICSDRSYQRLLDDYGKFHDEIDNSEGKVNSLDEIYKEAILSQSSGQIYLLDYGLASRFVDGDGNHKELCMDARKAHDGTLEYSSRDSHIGAHSRRSDLETLGYNILDWLTGALPWKTPELLAEPDLVHALKKNFMSDIKLLLKTCFKTEFYPQFIEKYFQYVTSLDFKEKPDYEYCKSLFKSELLKNDFTFDNKDGLINFNDPKVISNINCHSKRFAKKNTGANFRIKNGIKKAYERENFCSLENNMKLELLRRTLNISSDGQRKPCTSRNFFISDADLVTRLKKSLMPHEMFGKKLSPKNLRSKKRNIKKSKKVRKHRNSIGKFGNFMGSSKQFTWAEILARNPEDIIRKERNPQVETFDDDDSTCKYRIRKLSCTSDNSDTNLQSPILQKDYLKGVTLTYAMKEVIANFKRKVSRKSRVKEDSDQIEGYTPAMMAVHKLRDRKNNKARIEEVKEDVVSSRCTRSMASKKADSKEKLSCKKAATDSDKEDVTQEKPTITKKSSKKENKVVKSKSAVELSSSKSPPSSENKKTARKTQVTVNRIRLRSSNRQKLN